MTIDDELENHRHRVARRLQAESTKKEPNPRLLKLYSRQYFLVVEEIVKRAKAQERRVEALENQVESLGGNPHDSRP